MFDPSEPIWQRRWFQLTLGALIVVALGSFLLPPIIWAIYATRSVLLPVLIALVLAYVADPLVTWLQEHARIPRPVTAVGLIFAAAGAVVGLILYLGPRVVTQARLLILRTPDYISSLVQRLELSRDVELLSERLANLIGMPLHQQGGTAPLEEAPPIIAEQIDPTHLHHLLRPETGPLAAPATIAESLYRRIYAGAPHGSGWAPGDVDLREITITVLSWLDVGYEVLASTIGFATYLTVTVAIIAFCFYFFVWKFRQIIRWFVPFIPHSHRERSLEILAMMDRSVSAFIRGRLLQATVVAIVLSVGWSPLVAGVPYFLLLGIGGGILNLIPYAAVVAWPLAMLLAWVDAIAQGQATMGLDIWQVLILPTAVYLLAQGLDGWVLEPLVQGKATNLQPVTVLLAVLIGGSLAGLLGMLIAIPTMACIHIFAREVALPKLQQWAAET